MCKRIGSFILACVMLVLAVPALALSSFAAEGGSSAAITDAWTGSAEDAALNLVPEGYEYFVSWFKDGVQEPVGGSAKEATAKVNPQLIAAGIVSAEDNVYAAFYKWADYMKENAKITYNGNWSLSGINGDSIETIAHYHYYNNRSIGGLFPNYNEIVPLNDAAWIVKSEIDRVYDALWSQLVNAGAIWDNNIMDLGLATSDVLRTSVRPQTWETSSSISALDSGIVCRKTGAAYTYTAPAEIFGTAKVSIPTIAFLSGGQDVTPTAGAKVSVALNGVVVWPANATLSNPDSWYSLSGGNLAALNEALTAVSVDVEPGTQISVCVSKVTNAEAVRMEPAVSIEKKLVVEYKDADGELLTSHVVSNGGAVPKAPYAASADGWIINGEAADELPATVTGDMTIQYAGEPTIVNAAVEAVSISVSSDFAINVYLSVDEYAKQASISDDAGYEYEGVLQADGTYKVTIPGFPAKEMDQEVNLWLCQKFEDGYLHDAPEAYVLVPADVLKAYADSDASAEEKAVAAAALDYAAAAKAYFAGEALDAEVSARLAAQDAAIAAIESDVEVADGGDYFVNGMVLVLKDRVTFKIRVASTMYDPMDAETLDFVVSVEGKGTENEYNGFVYTEGSDEYDITMTLGGVSAADFDETFKFTVKNGSLVVSEIFEYSVNDYIARTFDAAAKEADLLRAIYALGVAANNA